MGVYGCVVSVSQSLDSYANVVEAVSVMGQAYNMLCSVLSQVEHGLVSPIDSVRLVRAGLKALKIRDGPQGGASAKGSMDTN